MRCIEPSASVAVAIHASRGPGRWFITVTNGSVILVVMTPGTEIVVVMLGT
jgi:hypothetical protein